VSLINNIGNVRTNLKIDPQKKIWSDATITRFINEGQRWLINQSNINWDFGETMGYILPVLDYQEYRTSSDDNPETYFSTKIRNILKWDTGSFGRLPVYNSGSSNTPSVLTEYATRYFINAGYDTATTYTTLHNMDTYNGNGTWAGTNDATTVATDGSTYKEGSGSVSFTIDVSNSNSNKATLTNPDMTGVDISAVDLTKAGIILWCYLTDASEIRSFELKFGSDSTNYYACKQYSVDVQGNNYADGWNRIFIPTVNKQTTGTPDLSSTDYLQLNIEFDSSETDQSSCRIDNIQIADKYLRYWYTRKATDLSGDSDESVIHSQYQFIYELYAEYKCWNNIRGEENRAIAKKQEATLNKNTMIDELQYNTPQEFVMPPRT